MGVANVHMGASVEKASVEGAAVTSLVELGSRSLSRSPEGLNSLVLYLFYLEQYSGACDHDDLSWMNMDQHVGNLVQKYLP